MSNKDVKGPRLFADVQTDLFEKSYEEQINNNANRPITCLGLTFDNDKERRRHFTEKLREKLLEPEFRKIEGFPIGSDEDILALSNPPYYTACPNPWISDFIAEWEANKTAQPEDYHYHREPFAADVSEGKNDPVYSVHAYPTKVPPEAIVPLINHYIDNNGIILDPFCGTGMTGVAAKRCKNNMTILQDLSPLATHIATGLADKVPAEEFSAASSRIIDDVEKEFGWMYESQDKNNINRDIRYFVWSDIYRCEDCGEAIRIWDIEGDQTIGGLKEKKPCPKCNTLLSKQTMSPVIETVFDKVILSTIQRIKSVPVLKVIVTANRSTKLPIEKSDLDLLAKIESMPLQYPVPKEKMLFKDGQWGDQWRSSYHLGITHPHQFFTCRNLQILTAIWDQINKVDNYQLCHALRFWFTSALSRLTRLNRYMAQHDRHVGPLAGTLFIGPIQAEISPFYFFREKRKDVISSVIQCGPVSNQRVLSSTNSSTKLQIPDNTIDYIFTDPPFGDNLMYSELNFILESWLGVYTNQSKEAVIATSQSKGLSSFQSLISGVFQECYRVLKPGRWMTVEFHNSRNTVWVSIQEAISTSGFIIADVRTLDKQKGTTKQLTQAGTVKQDLIISAYKPNGGLEDRFKLVAGTEEGAWDFTRTHLNQLPVFVSKDGQAEIIVERQNYLLFDRMVAFHVQRGFTVPLSATEFYNGLAQRFSERDGMYFLPEHVAEYDKKRMTVKEILQLQFFVNDEASAIQWLKQQVTLKPQTFQEIHPQFIKEIGGWNKNETPLELSTILEQNFLYYNGKDLVPEQIHAYLSTNWKELRNLPKDDPALIAKARDRWYVPDPNKAGDLEKLREKALLREFEEYKENKKKLKVFRLEAVRAGFKKAWQERDYPTIVAVADKIPNNVMEEDPKLLMWYDQAVTRLVEV